MRRLAEIVRGLRDRDPLELTEEDRRPSASDRHTAGRRHGEGDRHKLDQLAREIDQVAKYVGSLKREIRGLKAGEVYSKRLPDTVSDLRSVHSATKQAADRIMASAEAILAHDARMPDYTTFVTNQVIAIMEACSFEDLAGQRLDRAMDTLLDLEHRLERFAKSVKIADAAEFFDRKAILKEARREVLLVQGPQDSDVAIEQTEIDKLFV